MKDAEDFQGCIIVGEGVTVRGSFRVPHRAVINGSLEGELEADELLIGKHGKLVGAVRVNRADIHGETHDSMHAVEHLVVRGTGRIYGKATYGLIEVERGGFIHGGVTSTEPRELHGSALSDGFVVLSDVVVEPPAPAPAPERL